MQFVNDSLVGFFAWCKESQVCLMDAGKQSAYFHVRSCVEKMTFFPSNLDKHLSLLMDLKVRAENKGIVILFSLR